MITSMILGRLYRYGTGTSFNLQFPTGKRKRRPFLTQRTLGELGLVCNRRRYTRSRFYLLWAYAIFDLVVQTIFRVNRRARSYLYRCKKVKLRCKLSDTKKVSSYMISHIDIPFPKYTSIIQKYWYFFKSSF